MYVYKVCSFNKDHSGSNLCNNHILPILTKTFCRATKSRADIREREYLDRRTFIPRYQIYEVFKLLCDSPKGQGGLLQIGVSHWVGYSQQNISVRNPSAQSDR